MVENAECVNGVPKKEFTNICQYNLKILRLTAWLTGYNTPCTDNNNKHFP